MTSAPRVRRLRAWNKLKNDTLLPGDVALLQSHLIVREDGKAELATWDEERGEFELTQLQTENLAGVQQRALYAKQEELEAEGGNVVATSLVLIRTPSGQPALLHWTGTEWARITTQELMK